MKKEELEKLAPSLSEEEADRILKLCDKEIAEQGEIFAELRAEEIREAAYKDAMAQAEENYLKAELERMINTELENANSRSSKVLKALIDTDAVSLADGKLSGLAEQLEALKKEYGFMFFDETKPKFTKELDRHEDKVDLSKLSYKERLRLYSEMPEVYSRLVK